MEKLRPAGPNERRCIVRQALDYYRSLIIGGVYTCNGISNDVSLKEILIKALKHCVSVHPILSAAISGEETEAPIFSRPTRLDLVNHIEILSSKQFPDVLDDQGFIQAALIKTHDQPLTSRAGTPPWKITVLPLSEQDQDGKDRLLILFAYYHSHGDGKSGLTFHKTFLEGLQSASQPDCAYSADKECATPSKPLLPPLEKAGSMRISWSYLLTPLLGAYLPGFIAEPLGIRASATPESEDQWRGRTIFFNPNDSRTGVEVINIKNHDLQKILTKCRTHKAKFTGLLHQVIVHSLSQNIDAETAGSFVSQTAVDLRKNLNGITEDDMAICTTAFYELFPRSQSRSSSEWACDESTWTAARKTTESLSECASTLQDQPVGLLSYLAKMYPWTKGQIGKQRDNSYEISNIMSFNPGPPSAGDKWGVDSMVFSQPANAGSGCLCFNAVSRAGGDFVMTISWQMGALDVEDEERLVGRIGASIIESMRAVSRG